MNFEHGAVWRPSGLLIRCGRIDDSGCGSRLLRIEDINPESRSQNVVTRAELARIGLWLVWKAIFSSPISDD